MRNRNGGAVVVKVLRLLCLASWVRHMLMSYSRSCSELKSVISKIAGLTQNSFSEIGDKVQDARVHCIPEFNFWNRSNKQGQCPYLPYWSKFELNRLIKLTYSTSTIIFYFNHLLTIYKCFGNV